LGCFIIIMAMSSTRTVAGFGFVRGKTANWTPPKKTRRTKLQAKELPKLLSASRWYCTTMEKTVPAKVIDIENNKINSMDRWTYLFLFE
jgi:hypothetical protein